MRPSLSRLKMRSAETMADCTELYFSARSLMGLEELLDVSCEGEQHAHFHRADVLPRQGRQPNSRISTMASALTTSITGRMKLLMATCVMVVLRYCRLRSCNWVVLFLFPAERLDHADARKAFGDEAVDARNERLHLHKIAVQRAPAQERDDQDQRHGREGHQRQPPVHVEHHHDDADQQEDVPEQADEHVVVEFVERLHVVGGAG